MPDPGMSDPRLTGTKAADPRERKPRCDHICLLDDDHVDRGELHFYGYELPSPRRDADTLTRARALAKRHYELSPPFARTYTETLAELLDLLTGEGQHDA